MTNRTSIEWTEATWNPVTGCTRTSPGCEHCYIERTPPMRIHGRRFDGPRIGATTGVQLHPQRLEWPLRQRKPLRVFVCSMADLFHDEVPDAYIARVWAAMAATPHITYQVLTKRHARMNHLLNSGSFFCDVADAWDALWVTHGDTVVERDSSEHWWPLSNVWVGVSAENQQWANIRIPTLLGTPAAVRFVSLEPLLGPIDLQHAVTSMGERRGHGLTARWVHTRSCCQKFHGIDWVIAGGESGPHARAMDPDWVRSLRDQCHVGDVPFFFKQWGGRTPKAAGRTLDGSIWVQTPSTTTTLPERNTP
ncbi:MAG: phage Gp37/Gp68 family protein [Mycobacteriaceae bacterium]|nr:phage Gp37/Gp68 family protein [Mycobacteriaceae bacterium]